MQKHTVHESECERVSNPGHWGMPMVWERTFPIKNGFEVGVAGYDATEYPPAKTHHDDEALYVITGEGAILLNGTEVLLTPGTMVYVPPNTPHTIRRTSIGPLKTVYCHSGQNCPQP